ncbi:MAG: helical backbone metal receptor [Bacteroidota bacterium]
MSDLGLDNEVVGITKFCVHPEHWRQTKTIIGGTKNVDVNKIHSFHPDLIIANKEENTKEDIENLSKYRVYVSDIKTVDEAFQMMNTVAELTNTSATKLIDQIKYSFTSLPSSRSSEPFILFGRSRGWQQEVIRLLMR